MTSGGSLFWNSTQSELTSTFGYSYPELANLATANPQAEMQAIVLELYGSEAMKNRAAKVAKLLEDEKKLPNALKAAAPMAKKVDLNMFPNVNAASKSQALQAPAQMVFAGELPSVFFCHYR